MKTIHECNGEDFQAAVRASREEDLQSKYEQLSALCAQMAAALESAKQQLEAYELADSGEHYNDLEINAALTAYRTLSPDPQWQRVPPTHVVVPKRPTPEMLKAGMDGNPTVFNDGTDRGFREGVANDVYVCMIETAHANRARGEG